jgi:hypothetical protein
MKARQPFRLLWRLANECSREQSQSKETGGDVPAGQRRCRGPGWTEPAASSLSVIDAERRAIQPLCWSCHSVRLTRWGAPLSAAECQAVRGRVQPRSPGPATDDDVSSRLWILDLQRRVGQRKPSAWLCSGPRTLRRGRPPADGPPRYARRARRRPNPRSPIWSGPRPACRSGRSILAGRPQRGPC